MTFEQYSHLKTAIELKDEGNAEFRAGRFAQAVEKYKAALRKARREPNTTDETRGILLCNQAVCLVKLSRWEEAIEAASAVRSWMMTQSAAAQAITMYDKWGKTSGASTKMMAKARLYRARAYRSSEHRDRIQAACLATTDLEVALSYEPKDRTILSELREARRLAVADTATIDSSPIRAVPDILAKSDEAGLPPELLSDSKIRNALRRQLDSGPSLYDEEDLLRQREADAAERARAAAKQEEGPPREWMLERMKEALERQRAGRNRNVGDDDASPDVTKGYVQIANGGESPAWSGSSSLADPIVSESLAKAAEPIRLEARTQLQPSEQTAYNRGYKEVDVSVWCRRRLYARLRALQASMVDHTVREGRAGVVRCSPIEATGEALMVRVGDRWNRAYDMAARLSFEARIGAPRTVEVEIKGEKQRMFMGVPTVRGAIVVRELTHVEGPREAIIELQWGYGGNEMHFEKDEVGMTKDHAALLRAFLTPPKEKGQGTVHSAIVEMLERFVRDFETEIPSQPKPRLADIPVELHKDAVSADDAVHAATNDVEILLPKEAALAPWKWEKPEPPKTTFDVAPGSKLAKLQGASGTQGAQISAKSDGSEQTDTTDLGHQGDARGGFGHNMMEQFEVLRKEGYTVLLGQASDPPPVLDAGECTSSNQPAQGRIERKPPRPGTLDYSKFNDVQDSDDETDAQISEKVWDPENAANAEAKITQLGPETSRLWNAILKIADGDPVKAQKLMQDPDSLRLNPEIAAIYEDEEVGL